MDIIKSIEHEQMKNKIPELRVGNTVKVHVRVKEGNRERIQVFEGTIIKVQGGGINQTFTVRRIASGVGVEKTFLVHSPAVEKVEVTRVGKARRAKLFYLRDRVGGLFSGTVAFSSGGFSANRLFDLSISLANG